MKRIFDLTLVILASPVWLPVVALVALLVRLKLGSPVFFRQKRPGLNGRIFEIIKFRTMLPPRPGASEGQVLQSDAQRLTSFGRRLRASSLDELPELFNVLRGEMSLVGPRPLMVQYLERYSARQARRHEVRPGITGLAQVKGRNALTWEEKFEWDVRYVETRTLGMDIAIIVETIGAVFSQRGISAAGEATMPEFRGAATPRVGTGKEGRGPEAELRP